MAKSNISVCINTEIHKLCKKYIIDNDIKSLSILIESLLTSLLQENGYLSMDTELPNIQKPVKKEEINWAKIVKAREDENARRRAAGEPLLTNQELYGDVPNVDSDEPLTGWQAEYFTLGKPDLSKVPPSVFKGREESH